MIAGKRSPFGPKVELLVVLPHQFRHPIPLLSPILAHRTYASANEKESTGGRLASDHNYEALRAAAALARPPRNGLGVTCEGLSVANAPDVAGPPAPRGLASPQNPRLPVFAAPRQKHGTKLPLLTPRISKIHLRPHGEQGHNLRFHRRKLRFTHGHKVSVALSSLANGNSEVSGI